jgi:hypothetical protein
MARVSLQGNTSAAGNPYVGDVGKASSDAVIIYSDLTGTVEYQIRRLDQSPLNGITGDTTITVASNGETSELVQAVSSSSLQIVLPFRTEFQARCRRTGGTWGSWVNFKTKDKTYALPDVITETRVTTESGTHGETVTVLEGGMATITPTAAGATVVNTYKGDNDVTSQTKTARGETIVRKTRIVETSTGARVYTD